MRFVTLFLVLTLSQLSLASTSTYVLCKNAKRVRTIRVIPESGEKGCQTAYTKSGKDRVIGVARNEATCFGFLKNVKRNLEEAQWKCRDISHAKISLSEASTVR